MTNSSGVTSSDLTTIVLERKKRDVGGEELYIVVSTTAVELSCIVVAPTIFLAL